MENRWQTVAIFISSTFKDMQIERDLINRLLVPALNQLFNPHKILVRLIDMRWGINTENIDENDREQHILDVCLQEIDRSRPFFVGLIGERYGWIPPAARMGKFGKLTGGLHKGTSVTELEILYGVFRNPDPGRAVFCFRNSISDLPESEKDIYTETEEERRKAVGSLRETVRKKMSDTDNGDSIIDYDSVWKNGHPEPDENFITGLTKVLSGKICEEFGINSNGVNSGQSPFAVMKTLLETHRHSLTLNTVHKDKMSVGQLTPGACIKVDGPPRCGKSVFLAQIVSSLTELPDFLPIYYSTLADTECRNPMTMLNYFCYMLCLSFGKEWEEVQENTETETLIFGTKVNVNNAFPVLEKKLASLCKSCCESGKKPVFLIDSIDMLAGERYRDSLLFANDFSTIIFACPQDTDIACSSVYSCRHYDRRTAEAVINTALEAEAKELHLSAMKALTDRAMLPDGSYSAGWLSLALYWLVNLDAHDFDSIRNNEAESEEAKIEKYFIDFICSLPVDEGTLLREFAMNNGSIFGPELVSPAVTALALSPFGISERELSALVGENWDELDFARFRRWFAPFISESPSLRSWQIKSPSIRESLKQMTDGSFYRKMTWILEALPEEDPVRKRDLPSYALAAEDYALCASLLASPSGSTAENFALALSLLTSDKRIDAGYKIMSAAKQEDKPAVAAFLILMLFLRKNMVPVETIAAFASDIVPAMIPDDYADNEYALTCLSALCSELSLLTENFGTPEQFMLMAETLLATGRTKYKRYRSFDSKQSLYKGLVAMASCYMENGEYEKSMAAYAELAELSASDD